MPWTYRRMAGAIGLTGGSLSLIHRLDPPLSEEIDRVLGHLMGELARVRHDLNGLGAPLLPAGWGPLGGLGDLILILTFAGMVTALLHERRPRWVQDVEELVARWRTRGQRRRRRTKAA